MSDGSDHAGNAYEVPPEVWHRAKVAVIVLLVVGIVVLVGSGLGFSAGADARPIALAGVVVGLLLTAYGVIGLLGSARIRRMRFALTVGPSGLVVDAAGATTAIAWGDVEYAESVAEGPHRRTLEIRPRPGAQIAFPPRIGLRERPMPQPCSTHRGNVRVFSLTMLGPRAAECLSDVEGYVPVRDRAAGQATT